jgi:hypothetical protein
MSVASLACPHELPGSCAWCFALKMRPTLGYFAQPLRKKAQWSIPFVTRPIPAQLQNEMGMQPFGAPERCPTWSVIKKHTEG